MALEILVGTIAGILGAGGFIYQSIKNPIGMTYPIIIFTGVSVGLWAGYGILIENPIMYIPNIIIVATLGVIGGKKLK